MKTGCTSTMKNIIFSLCSVCTVFVPFKIEHFQSSLTIRDLHDYKGVPHKAQPPSDVLGGCAFKIREIFFTIYILFLNEFCLMCRL